MAKRRTRAEREGNPKRSLVAISPRTNELLDDWVDHHPAAAKGRVMELLLEFFCAAPDSFQSLMLRNRLGDMEEKVTAAAHAYLDEIIRRAKDDPPPNGRILESPEATDTGGRQSQQPRRGPRPGGR